METGKNLITEMLEAEIARSEEFTKSNFGMKVGDGFPEMVKELCQSQKVPGRLFLNLLMAGLTGKSVADEVGKMPYGQEPDFGPVILNNLSTFELPLSMLYWGIQIGRKMEREEVEALRKIGEM